MELARAGKVKAVPMQEKPMGETQKWIEQLRAGKVVGRIMLCKARPRNTRRRSHARRRS